jgi:RND family efflux transporter MFP subunit
MIKQLVRGTTWGLLAAALATLSACSRSQARAAAQGETPDDRQTVAVVKVARGDIAQTLTVAAEFRPYQEIDVHAKVSGFLKEISVDVGDRVQAGQLLATLEVPEMQDELQQDDAAIKRAQEEINRASADLDRAKSVHDVAHIGATRLEQVMQSRPKLVAQQDVDEAAGRDRASEAQVATANAALAAAREQLEFAKASQRKTSTLFAYARITAPFGGVVTRRYADTGAMIQAGTASQTQAKPLVQLSDISRLRLVIPVPESAVPRVHLGGAVSLRVQSLDKTFAGTVARFADRLDTDTRTMHVEVDVPNPSLEIVPGMFANASIVLNDVKNALLVPVGALDRTERGVRVLVVDGMDRIEPRDIGVGLETADRVQVTSGLEASEMVVAGNRGQLKAGTVVSPKVMESDTAQEPR